MCSDVYCIVCTYVRYGMAWHGMERPNSNMPSHISLFISYLFFTIYFPCTFPSYHHSACILTTFFFPSSCFFSPLFVLFVVHFWHVCFLLSHARKLHQWPQCWLYGCLCVCVSVSAVAIWELVPMSKLVGGGGLCSIQTTLYHRTCILYIPCIWSIINRKGWPKAFSFREKEWQMGTQSKSEKNKFVKWEK